MVQNGTGTDEGGKPVWVYPLASVAAWGIGVAIVFRFFDTLRFIFLGFLAACCLAAALRPLRDRLPGPPGLRAVMAGLIPLVVTVLILAGISYLLAVRVADQVAHWPETRQEIDRVLANVSWRLHIAPPLTVQSVGDQVSNYFSYGGGANIATATAAKLSYILVALAMLFFGSLYLLSSRWDELETPMLKAFPPRRRQQVNAAIIDIDLRLRWWTIGSAIDMTAVAVITGIAFTIIGLDMAIPLAIVTGAFEIVPTLGPIAAFLIAVVFAATQGVNMIIGVSITYILTHIVESYILVPFVMKRTVYMPPVITLFSVVLWGEIFGPPGLIMALPLNLVLVSFADRLLRRAD